MKNAKLSGADISRMQIQVKWKNKLSELFCGPILNYDRNDDKHDCKNNNYNDYDINHYGTSHDYNNNSSNDSKTSEIQTKRQRNIFEVLVFYFQR